MGTQPVVMRPATKCASRQASRGAPSFGPKHPGLGIGSCSEQVSNSAGCREGIIAQKGTYVFISLAVN